jgi:hypothetical protein
MCSVSVVRSGGAPSGLAPSYLVTSSCVLTGCVPSPRVPPGRVQYDGVPSSPPSGHVLSNRVLWSTACPCLGLACSVFPYSV